jgi:hypothetical protein
LPLETPTLLENGCYGEHTIHLPCLLLRVGCCRLFEDLYFNLMYVCMLFTMNGCMRMDANVCTCILGMDDKNPYNMNI